MADDINSYSSFNSFDDEFQDTSITKAKLQDDERFKRFRQFIGLSTNALAVAGYDNNLIFKDSQDFFAKRMISLSPNFQLKHSTIEVRVAKRRYQISKKELPTQNEFLTFFIKEASSFEGNLIALADGAYAFTMGRNEHWKPEVTYAAMAIYQWARLNIDSSQDTDGEYLWRIFNGLYNKRESLRWAKTFIQAHEIESNRFFRETSPAKLMTIYLEENIRFEEAARNLKLIPQWNDYYKIAGPETYFNDNYPISKVGLT